MAGGFTSRLYNEIREKRNLAYSVKGESMITKDFGYNFVYVGTMKENVEQVRKLILEEFEKVAEGLEEKELEEMKNQMIGVKGRKLEVVGVVMNPRIQYQQALSFQVQCQVQKPMYADIKQLYVHIFKKVNVNMVLIVSLPMVNMN